MTATLALHIPCIECRRLAPEWTPTLLSFLHDLEKAGDDVTFKPHPFTAEAIEALARAPGHDFYCVLVDGSSVLAYGMLRGWNQGYAVPSLGIAVHPSARGQGLARALMHMLHAVARRRGCAQVRLRVRRGNRARMLYEGLGYQFEDGPGEYAIGLLTFARTPPP